MPDEPLGYITMDGRWISRECPLCKEMATAHGWLYNEPPPPPPRQDKRKVIGEVFQHFKSPDCVVRTQG